MKEEKKVSIVLPVYNGEKTIRNAIYSVINQIYTNWELIVVNDCSNDDTEKIVSQIIVDDPRIILINNAINCKLPKSLNVGFSYATGDYFTWTSDDNMFLPNALEKMVAALENNHNCGFVYCDYTVVDNNYKKIGERKVGPEKLLIYWNVVGACFLYRRHIAELVGKYDETMFLAEDYDYWLRIYQHTHFLQLCENLYLYMEHSGSLTATRKDEIAKVTYNVHKKHLNFIMQKTKKDNCYERNLMFDEICIYSDHAIEQRIQFVLRQKGYGVYCLKKIIKKLFR